MIISKTPLRISFVGGGSDIIDNHNKEGSVISVTINKFVYVLLKKNLMIHIVYLTPKLKMLKILTK